eukprot:718242-Alexandrium_andersonii.AAC.1
MATAPGFSGPAAGAPEATARWNSREAAHSPAASASQWISCRRRSRPSSRCLMSTALSLLACCAPCATSQ